MSRFKTEKQTRAGQAIVAKVSPIQKAAEDEEWEMRSATRTRIQQIHELTLPLPICPSVASLLPPSRSDQIEIVDEPTDGQCYSPEEKVTDSSSYTFRPPVESIEIKYFGGEEKSDVQVY